MSHTYSHPAGPRTRAVRCWLAFFAGAASMSVAVWLVPDGRPSAAFRPTRPAWFTQQKMPPIDASISLRAAYQFGGSRPPSFGSPLARMIESVDFRGTPPNKAFETWADTAGIKLTVDSPNYIAGGKPVDLQLRNVTASVALRCLLTQAEPGCVAYAVKDGTIRVSYIVQPIDFAVYDLGPLMTALHAHSVSAEGDFSSSGSGVPAACRASGYRRSEVEILQGYEDTLNHLITENVAPDSWRTAGGSYCSMQCFGGYLFVSHLRQNQEQILALLASIPQ